MNPALLIEQKWQTALLESVLDEVRQKVSETNYRILWSRLIEGRKTKDVATELNLSPEKIHYRYHRLIRKLRAHLAFFVGENLGAPGSQATDSPAFVANHSDELDRVAK